MSNSFYYVDGGGTTHHYWTAGSAGSTYRVVRTPPESWAPNWGHFIEGTPNRMANQYRSATWQEATYEVTVFLHGTSASSLLALKSAWEDWHDPELGEGYVKRITFSGATRCLDCIPVPPTFDPDQDSPATAYVTQRYIAAMPWWRGEAMSTSGGVFAGTTGVTVTCGNAGDIPSYPLVTITGGVTNPRITIGTDSFHVSGSQGAGDVMTIDMRPQGTYRMSVYKQAAGTGARTYMVITSASKYLTLPKGTTGVVLDASAGTAGVVVSWYNYYRSLY